MQLAFACKCAYLNKVDDTVRQGGQGSTPDSNLAADVDVLETDLHSWQHDTSSASTKSNAILNSVAYALRCIWFGAIADAYYLGW